MLRDIGRFWGVTPKGFAGLAPGTGGAIRVGMTKQTQAALAATRFHAAMALAMLANVKK